MLEVIITAKLLSSAESEVIGIKEALTAVIEPWADCIGVDVKTSAPLQMTFEDKPEIRQTVTTAAALEYFRKNKLTVEEGQNIIQALIDYNKIASECD